MKMYRTAVTALAVLGLAAASYAAQITFMRGTNQIWNYPTNDGSVPVVEKPANNNWVSPNNYTAGYWYMRYEAVDKPSTMTVGVQLCFWMPGWSPETCSNQLATSIEKVYYFRMSNPSAWWHNGTYPWSANDYYKARLFHKAGTGSILLAVSSCGSYCYTGDITQHVPIKFNVEIIATTAGHTFVPPASWTGCPWGNVNDETPPQVTSVTCTNPNKVNVIFNEPMKSTTVTNKANYSISNGVTVSSVGLSANTAVLTTSAVTPSTAHTITINNVQDAAGNTIAANTTKSFTYVPFSGWMEDFDDGAANGWTTGEGTWTVSGGSYGNTGSGRTSAWYGGQSFDDITYTADVTPASGTDVWMIFRVQDASNYYLFTLGNSGKGALYKLSAGSYTKLADGTGSFSTGNTYAMKVELNGSSIKVYANNSLVASATDGSYSEGYVGFGSNNTTATFDNAAVPSSSPIGLPFSRFALTPAHVGLTVDPNPVNSKTAISFFVPYDHSDINVRLTDLNGRNIIPLLYDRRDHGQVTVRWDGMDQQNRPVRRGIYLVELIMNGQLFTQKLILTN